MIKQTKQGSRGHAVPTWGPDQVRAAVQGANIPTLLMVVYQFTGDEKWLGDRYAPTRAKGLDWHDSGGLAEDVQDEIREAGIDAIIRLQAGEPGQGQVVLQITEWGHWRAWMLSALQ